MLRPLHDSELLSVSIDRKNGFAEFVFQLEGGETRLVRLEGVQAFRGEDLTLQNVVSRVLRASRGDLGREDIEKWITWATSLSDASSWLRDERRHEWLEACANGALEVVVFEPSAGAQIVAICKSMAITRS